MKTRWITQDESLTVGDIDFSKTSRLASVRVAAVRQFLIWTGQLPSRRLFLLLPKDWHPARKVTKLGASSLSL